jgi:hypothetical protein
MAAGLTSVLSQLPLRTIRLICTATRVLSPFTPADQRCRVIVKGIEHSVGIGVAAVTRPQPDHTGNEIEGRRCQSTMFLSSMRSTLFWT